MIVLQIGPNVCLALSIIAINGECSLCVIIVKYALYDYSSFLPHAPLSLWEHTSMFIGTELLQGALTHFVQYIQGTDDVKRIKHKECTTAFIRSILPVGHWSTVFMSPDETYEYHSTWSISVNPHIHKFWNTGLPYFQPSMPSLPGGCPKPKREESFSFFQPFSRSVNIENTINLKKRGWKYPQTQNSIIVYNNNSQPF